MIGQIHPSTKRHTWILGATDYFTKWVEVIPIKNATSKNMVRFIKEHIIYISRIPNTITMDEGLVFIPK